MTNFNKDILDPKIQEFINQNINSDVANLALKGIPFDNNLKQDIITQIESKKKCEKKLPTWFNTPNIYFPPKLNIEQTSSEVTAQYKSNLISGKSIIDITGGFGVDCYYFSKKVDTVIHCDLNVNLSKIVEKNSSKLKLNNITFHANDGLEVLKTIGEKVDWIYIDPSRRNDIKGKVFLLKDCLPNVPKNLDILFQYSKNIMIKTSPILDISSGISELQNVKHIHCVAVNNEVKELLWILEKDFSNEIQIKTINITNKDTQCFNFNLKNELETTPTYSQPLNYLYEPNTAILKSGAFNSIAGIKNIYKLHKHSHLYTSNDLTEFPGRRFKIIKTIPYNKKSYKKEINLNQANITTRNFPETVAQIRNKFKIKDGGKNYLFFTTILENSKTIISSVKI
ncbi:class I SAM-dependent methyltransferase [Olleya sp. Ti.3.14]|uniref:class I SAM-dependent methyltransferase n=1 Tax=Olleya sp. Ti.3.14 TaxID=3121297 RepID=UPI003120113B